MTSESRRPGPGATAGVDEVSEQPLSPDQQYQAIRDRLNTVLRGHGLDPEHPTGGEISDSWVGNSGTNYNVLVEVSASGRLKFIARNQEQSFSFSYNSGNHVTGDYLQYFLWEANPKDSQKPFLMAFGSWNISIRGEFLRSLGAVG